MNSSNGFQTAVWGPMAWIFLHMITLNYDPKRKRDTYKFFKSLKGVLPCGACRKNFEEIIQRKDPKYKLTKEKFKNREVLTYWLFIVHNEVQRGIYSRTKRQADKPVYKDTPGDYKKAMNKLEHMRAKCYKDSYGCTIPVKGERKRAEIHIFRRNECKKKQKDPLVIHKRCL
jgi:hypothetical protein